MWRTVKVKLDRLDANQVNLLRRTQSVVVQVFNTYVDWALELKSISRLKSSWEHAFKIKDMFPGFPTSMIDTSRAVALEAVKSTKFKFRPRKSPNSSIRYNKKIFTLRGGQLTLSTLEKRVKTIVSFPKWCQDVVAVGDAKNLDLCWDREKKIFVAHIKFSVPDPHVASGSEVVGIDRGLINVVATSRGEIFDSKLIRKNQRKFLYQRKVLSVKGTRSSKRRLRRLAGKEKRFNREQNHILTKKLASDPSVGIYVLENLKGITKKKKGKKLNKLLHSWSFFQFETFLTYKCEARGIKVVKVCPRHTSQKCSRCGIIKKENRDKSSYKCSNCGLRIHADVNAAINIAAKHLDALSVEQAAVNQGGDFTAPATR